MKLEKKPYYLIEPRSKKIPFILSIPHCGTEFPEEIKEHFVSSMMETPDDTDWCLDKLYDFAKDFGISTIFAKYSRWVIDLNREPDSKPLYDDGRIITELCPTTDFLGNDIYKRKEFEPNQVEKERRLSEYFHPYHQKIDEIIQELKSEFGQVLFWDGHSIRRNVPTIQEEPFPDFILGNNDGKTAGQGIINTAFKSLEDSAWQINHNQPFKGGYLTRSKGNPKGNVHALQLEMSKDLYMSHDELKYDKRKAEKVKRLLIATFENLISELDTQN